MLNPKANPLLVKTEAEICAKVPPEQSSAFERIVLAGMKILDSDQTHQMVVSQLKQQADPSDIAGAGVAKLMGILINQSNGSMLSKAVVRSTMLAASVLLCEAMDRLEGLGRVQVTPDTLAAAQHSLSSSLMQLLGVDQNKLAKMTSAPAQAAQPAALARRPGPAQSALIGAPT